MDRTGQDAIAPRHGPPDHPDPAPPADFRHDRAFPPDTRALGPRLHQGPVYAALDLGTNNCRLLIARQPPPGAEPGSLRVLDSFCRIVRLGEGISRTGCLSEAAMARTIEALEICRARMQARHVGRSRLIATEACRAAGNGAEFVARVEDETGLRLEIVDRETEALLAAGGCSSLADPDAQGIILFDIGGGSFAALVGKHEA